METYDEGADSPDQSVLTDDEGAEFIVAVEISPIILSASLHA